MDSVKIFRGKHRDPSDLFGPLPGYRHGNVVAYEFELPVSFEPWPGRSRLERTFMLLDLGPRVIGNAPDDPCFALLFEWLPGRPL